MNNTYKKFSYDEHARKCDPLDFHKQILRTQSGQPISDEQVKIIFDVIYAALKLNKNDYLLDLACGNACLSHLLFPYCQSYLGVDISEYLIDIAKTNFGQNENIKFVNTSVSEYFLSKCFNTTFTKLLCFGSCQYLSDEEFKIMLEKARVELNDLKIIFLGNIPDKEFSEHFYKSGKPSVEELNDHQTAIGKWRSKQQILELANTHGWHCEFSKMPSDFYATDYRFNATLTRKVDD